MSAPIYDQDGEPRYYGFYFGIVVDNVDPEKLGRVRVKIPGLVEPESNWAWPFAMGGGSAQSGGWSPPKKGAAVGVMFNGGDIDGETAYFSGWYGRGESPSPAKDASPEDAANKIKAFESDRHLVVLDGRGGKEQVLIKDKASGNVIVMKGTGEILLGSEQGLTFMDGVVTGQAVDTLTGLPMWMLGHSSKQIWAKK